LLSQEENKQRRKEELDFLEERRDWGTLIEAIRKQRMVVKYKKTVGACSFNVGYLVLRRNDIRQKNAAQGS